MYILNLKHTRIWLAFFFNAFETNFYFLACRNSVLIYFKITGGVVFYVFYCHTSETIIYKFLNESGRVIIYNLLLFNDFFLLFEIEFEICTLNVKFCFPLKYNYLKVYLFLIRPFVSK